MYGEQERLYKKEHISIKDAKIEVYIHNNGIIIVPNTESNCKAMENMELSDIQKAYTILDKKEEEPATSSYRKYLYIFKKKGHSPRK